MLIRKATAADLPDLLRLLHQVCDIHAEIRPDIFKSGGVKYNESDLLAILSDDLSPIWCALEEGRFLGYCFCKWKEHRDSSVFADRRELYIDDLCVDETVRGKGIATALFRHVTAIAKAEGADSVTLNVWHGNSALNFYEKMGMRPRKTILELPLEEKSC